MLIQFVLFALVPLIAPYMPRILTPITYSVASVLLVQNFNPRFILGWFVAFSTLAAVILRFLVGYIISKFQAYQKKNDYKDLISRRTQKAKSYFETKKVNRSRSSLKRHLASDRGQVTLFVLAVIGFAPTIPDFLTVALLQKKLKFPYFVLAAIVGKTIQFLPFVFLGKGILAYFKL